MFSDNSYRSQDTVSAQEQIDICVVPSLFARVDLLKLRFYLWLNQWSASKVQELTGEQEIDEDFADLLVRN